MGHDQSQDLSIRVIDNVENINVLINTLNAPRKLLSSLSNLPAPSLNKYWLTGFINSYGKDRDMAITVIYKDNAPRLIMPLQKRADGELEFLCDETSDYNDFLFDDADRSILQYGLEYWISKGIRSFRLARIPHDSKTITLLTQIAYAKGWSIKIDTCDTIPIILAQPEKDIQYWEGVKVNHIKRYKRKLRALSSISKISFSLIETKSQLITEFPAIRDLHVSRWDSINMYSKYSDKRREAFILSVCEEALKEQALFFPLMKIDDVLASYIIGFRGRDIIFDWNTSFSVDFWRWSPGALLLLHVLSNPELYKYRIYNLMKGTEKYKFYWTNQCENNLTVTIMAL